MPSNLVCRISRIECKRIGHVDGATTAQKRRGTRKECKSLREECEVGGFMAQKVCASPRKRMLDHRGAVPREDVDLLSENQAMHEEKLSQQVAEGRCRR